MSKAQSANELIEEARDYAASHDLPILEAWEAAILEQAHLRQLSADDKIFVLSDDKKSYDIILDQQDPTSDAYDRAMSGI
jgi:DNA-binding PucR family transcriptional regulator